MSVFKSVVTFFDRLTRVNGLDEYKNKYAYTVDESNRNREAISSEVQIFVWRRDGGRCVKCGSQQRLEYDHIIPVAMGGGNTARNMQLLCEHCNRSKGKNIGGRNG
jgi:5-methylcytosine-specific restriction endonuclease McrA